MKDCIVFVANGLSRENRRLQPWRYLCEIARRIAVNHEVVMITEGTEPRDEARWEEGFRVVKSSFLSVRRQRELQGLIDGYNPKQLWWSVTPRSIAYWRTLKNLSCEKYGMVTCPLYEYGQLVRASRAGVPFEELGVLWKQRLIPRFLFARMLGRGLFSKVFVQSEANRRVLLAAGVPSVRLSLLRVGIDPEDRAPIDPDTLTKVQECLQGQPDAVRLLYFGAVRRIRGFDALLAAFSRTASREPSARLVVLARGADGAKMDEVRARLMAEGLADRVDLIGGWLSREEVWGYIEACEAAVLPFVIVPSDIPIAILEAMARGRPVIGTPIDGIPELIDGRGMVVDPLDTDSFAKAMTKMVEDIELRRSLGENARAYMQTYPDWNQVGRMAMSEAALA